MPPDATTVRRLAAKTRFQPQRLEKGIRLTEFIAEIARHHDLGKHMKLKGGTALNVYHLPLPRLSVDADYCFIQNLEAHGLDARKEEVEAHLESIARLLGYTLKRYQDSHALRAYTLHYTSELGNTDHIKLDVNYLERMTVLPPVMMRAPDWLPIESVDVPVLALEELAGSKMATLLLRGAARDLFDVAQLAGLDYDRDLAQRIALFYGLLADLDLKSMDATRVDQVTAKDLKSNLLDLLPKRHELTQLGADEALTHLAKEAHSVVDGLLERDEAALVRDQLAGGDWRPEALFPDIACEHLAAHPGIAWRLQTEKT